MTTKPKARKFRIRRNTPLHSLDKAGAPAAENDEAAETQDQATQEQQTQGQARAVSGGDYTPSAARQGQVTSATTVQAEDSIDAIRKEGLTGRQLRMARRMAQKHGLAPTSDFDAVRQLRARGVDPFQRANLLELVSSSGNRREPDPQNGDKSHVQLPQTVPADGPPQLPSTELRPADRRAAELSHIQQEIGRRRRRRLLLLVARLLVFVMLPTLMAGYYYYRIATPMYSSKSAFLILAADGAGGMGGLGGLLPKQFSTGQDAIATQEYLESKDAMLRLDRDMGFREHFSQDWIDPLQRLPVNASNEKAYKRYKKFVKLGYDPTEGIIRMKVTTADPEVSKRFSEQLIKYAEERVDHLSQQKRLDAVKTATKSLEEAKADRRSAQQRLVSLQEGSILDPEGEIANIRQLIGKAEMQLQDKELALNTQMNNARPNAAKVDALRSQAEVLRDELKKQRQRLTNATKGKESLAAQTAAIQMAKADLATADMVLQGALEAKRSTEVEANKQVRYLTVSAKPVAAEDPSYPRAFENTLLAFLIFSGIYLMISLTVSVLREQVSS